MRTDEEIEREAAEQRAIKLKLRRLLGYDLSEKHAERKAIQKKLRRILGDKY